MSIYGIRPASKHDVRHLPSIEISAGDLFRSCENPQLRLLADDKPTSIDAHHESIGAWDSWGIGRGGTWVAIREAVPSDIDIEHIGTDDKQRAVGFIKTQLVQIVMKQPKIPTVGGSSTDTIKCFIHIDELSVHSNHQRQGIASKLIDAVKDAVQSLGGTATANIPSPSPQTGPLINIVGITLVTMQDVLFNRPFYEKHGFECFEAGGEDEKITTQFGLSALRIWQEDLDVFRGKGDGTLAEKRCWMSYSCSLEGKEIKSG